MVLHLQGHHGGQIELDYSLEHEEVAGQPLALQLRPVVQD